MKSINFEKGEGLVPAILQDDRTGQVLMLGYMNQEAYDKTREEGVAWFYSRSKERLWKKGESSGHIQEVVSIDVDCDQDTLLVRVKPLGPTCHTGTQSCFGDQSFNLAILEQTIAAKIANPQEGSYTKYLIDEGLDKILKKCGEEMTEVVLAAKNKDKEELIDESSDLLYHFLVLLQAQGVQLKNVEAKLAERHGLPQEYSIRQGINEW
ncbi:bifunctional phosphoribosyl-AMP cyclohydrolase/phosphoribosyl-ATP diphosphatase HisIE [Fundicoccus sp. Sow4_D5]|uniref:bifunctional phosphoribosyl-AMP cyclohydrolase/phosphoribosyl-ATP diphosphatase HisIE n=1 Tax=unclassified Fundicoccus TaxID=2761543 RepID=UPI003F90CF02